MKAGQTNLEVGTRVQIKNIKGEDSYLNGLIGCVTHPFAFGETKAGWIGIWIESNVLMPIGGQANVKVNECKIID